MKYNIKTLLLALVVVLTTNASIGEFLLNSSFLLKSTPKFCLALISFLLIQSVLKIKFSMKFSLKSIFYFLLSIGIIVWVFYNTSYQLSKVNSTFISLKEQLSFLLYNISVGLFEELFFRVFVFFFILKTFQKDLFISTVITSIIFALAHISNALNPNIYTLSVINQVLFAFSIGLLLQAIFIRTQSLFIVIILHSSINQLGTYKSKLLPEDNTLSVTEYNISDFLTSFILLSCCIFIICLPLVKVLLKNQKRNYKL